MKDVSESVTGKSFGDFMLVLAKWYNEFGNSLIKHNRDTEISKLYHEIMGDIRGAVAKIKKLEYKKKIVYFFS